VPRTATRMLWSLLATLAGCGAGEDLGAPSSATLQVITLTAGAAADAEGYTVIVDGEARAIGLADTLEVNDLSIADHHVELAGLPANCTTDGANPRIITLVPSSTGKITFQITCLPPPPPVSLAVSVATFGSAPDADGYSLLVDDAPGQAVSVHDDVVLTDLATGTHVLRLAGVATNCEVRDANPRLVDVPATGETRFEVTCVPAGGVIMYTSDRPGGNGFVMDIFVRNADGTSLRNLTNTPGVNERAPVWSPDGSQIAFVPFETTEIFVMAIGSRPRLVAGGLENVRGVRWSPDGRRLLFLKQASGSSVAELTTYTFATKQLRVLARDPPIAGSLSGYAWSPTGARVAYGIVDFESGLEISTLFTVSAAGGRPEVLVAASPGRGQVFGWSPDGGNIAYVQDPSRDRGDIYLVPPDGPGPSVNLTNSPGVYDEVTWSPDGQALAFRKSPGPNEGGILEYDLFSITRGGALRQLTHLLGDYSSLSWSSDGSRLVYQDNFQIHLINFDGTGHRVLTAGFINEEASWRP
jgi:Tol biopolymer transport system component